MNISQKRYIPQDLYSFTKLIKFKNYPLQLLGSSGIASQRFYSDYDLFSSIKDKNCEKVYYTLKSILEKTEDHPDMYFIEIKIQLKTGRKIRNFIELEKFCKVFKDIEFVKYDFVIWVNNKFVELSVIYSFSESETSFEDSIKQDIKELTKEKQYYKVLKRLFSLLLSSERTIEVNHKLIMLSKFFNSPFGQLYRNNSNLKAIKLLLENYEDEETKRRAELNLKDLKLNLKDIKRLEKIYNTEAKNLLNFF